MTTKDKRKLHKDNLSSVICNMEAIVMNINSVIAEVVDLVDEIDTIVQKVESIYKAKSTSTEICLDNNRNLCDVFKHPVITSQSNFSPYSPFLDYTFLELTNDCNVCVGNMYQYNEKYPLWIQNDTWKTSDLSVSEISEVSPGSSARSNSSRYVDTLSSNRRKQGHAGAVSHYPGTAEKENINQIRNCCVLREDNSELTSYNSYCGVYEHIMERQLEDLIWNEIGYDVDNYEMSASQDFSEHGDFSTEYVESKCEPLRT
ncbi:hypothetical protein DPMN_115182 [Dreissena polymorpha]|uniref:Uncharacterized protein n=1 Tax=Dreissena polymorpha TaxID=45954 RepID=A0A9D4QSE7_DREPO|nr:hypothetical protein DPMN_115182 [Dreissena polymorpha]